jgi:hypothetical protein
LEKNGGLIVAVLCFPTEIVGSSSVSFHVFLQKSWDRLQ